MIEPCGKVRCYYCGKCIPEEEYEDHECEEMKESNSRVDSTMT